MLLLLGKFQIWKKKLILLLSQIRLQPRSLTYKSYRWLFYLLKWDFIGYLYCTRSLGVWVADQLKFDVHVNDLVKKISAKLSWLSRLRRIVPQPVLVLTYKSYIQPTTFDYACTIWGCSNANINAIQRLQNRAAWIINSKLWYYKCYRWRSCEATQLANCHKELIII